MRVLSNELVHVIIPHSSFRPNLGHTSRIMHHALLKKLKQVSTRTSPSYNFLCGRFLLQLLEVTKMLPFREKNKFLIYLISWTGIYLPSIEVLVSNRAIILFFKIWSKIPLLVISLYVVSVIKFLTVDLAPAPVKLAMTRRLVAFSSFLFKAFFCFFKSRKMENLFDLWDSSFQDKFYAKEREVSRNLWTRSCPVLY